MSAVWPYGIRRTRNSHDHRAEQYVLFSQVHPKNFIWLVFYRIFFYSSDAFIFVSFFFSPSKFIHILLHDQLESFLVMVLLVPIFCRPFPSHFRPNNIAFFLPNPALHPMSNAEKKRIRIKFLVVTTPAHFFKGVVLNVLEFFLVQLYFPTTTTVVQWLVELPCT